MMVKNCLRSYYQIAANDRGVVNETSKFLYAFDELDKQERKPRIKKKQKPKVNDLESPRMYKFSKKHVISFHLAQFRVSDKTQNKQIPSGHNVVVVDNFCEQFQP